jgi:hypothetical protein
MADEAKDDAAAPPQDEAEPAAGTVNSQIVDAVTLLNTLALGQSPAAAAGMVAMMTADALTLGMLNAVARQQADATIASAAVAAACARMAGTSLPAGASGDLVRDAEAQAQAAILTLARAAVADGEAAKAALRRVARAAGAAAEGPPAPTAAAKARKSGTSH